MASQHQSPLHEMPLRPDWRLISSFTISPPAQSLLHKPWKQATQGPRCSGTFRCHFARSLPRSPGASSTMQPSLTTPLSYISCSSNSCSVHFWDPSFHIPFIEVHQMCVLFSLQTTQNITTMQHRLRCGCSVQGTGRLPLQREKLQRTQSTGPGPTLGAPSTA